MSHNNLRILMAQQNYTVGNLNQNTQQIIKVIEEYQSQVDIIVFPELSIIGYPPEDWLLRSDFQHEVNEALKNIQSIVKDTHVIVGHSILKKGKRFNAASVIHEGKIIAEYYKKRLPNYGVFDEERYFAAGSETCIFSVKGKRIGLLICEDIWSPGPWKETIEAGAELMVLSNASPFERHKLIQREDIIRRRQKCEGNIPAVYVNLVGGQDELIFDGQSFVMNEKGEVCFRAKAYEPDLLVFNVDRKIEPQFEQITPLLKEEALIYQALVLGTRDYIQKNGFKGALVGLSGGIDSALTLAIAVDALGAEAVEAVMMPSRYTAKMSLEDAKTQIKALKVSCREISIEPVFETFLSSLAFDPKKVTKENLQARCRGVLLMALSNETGKLLLTTGNKSEVAVGYCTLYGDMCGGLAVLKDVLKTWVYRLAHYRNSLSDTFIIPQRVLERAPSAELSENQTDQDSLPPYDVLDSIIEQYVEWNKSAEEIIDSGIDKDIVQKMICLFHLNEYKRRQSAPGIKVTTCAFGRDWRYPITAKR